MQRKSSSHDYRKRRNSDVWSSDSGSDASRGRGRGRGGGGGRGHSPAHKRPKDIPVPLNADQLAAPPRGGARADVDPLSVANNVTWSEVGGLDKQVEVRVRVCGSVREW